MSRTITVAVDPTLHSREPATESERATWEILDTAWNLLREGSVRVTLAEIREQLAEKGETFPSDEELFAENPGDPDHPRSYLDLAPTNELAAMGMAGAFQLLSDQAFLDASEGMGFTISDSSE